MFHEGVMRPTDVIAALAEMEEEPDDCVLYDRLEEGMGSIIFLIPNIKDRVAATNTALTQLAEIHVVACTDPTHRKTVLNMAGIPTD